MNDVSWDMENQVLSVPYSQYIASILRPGRLPGQPDPVTTKAPKVTKRVTDGKGGVSVIVKTRPTTRRVWVRPTGPVMLGSAGKMVFLSNLFLPLVFGFLNLVLNSVLLQNYFSFNFDFKKENSMNKNTRFSYTPTPKKHKHKRPFRS